MRSTFKIMMIVALVGAVAGGGIAVFLLMQERGLAEQSDALRRQVMKYFGPGRTFDDIRGDLVKQREDLKGRFDALRASMEFVPDERFKFSGQGTAGLEYSSIRDHEQSKLRDRANRAGVAWPPSIDPQGVDKSPDDAQAPSMMYRFAVNDCIASAAIDAKVAKLESIKHDLRKQEVDSGAFVQTIPVDVVVEGTTDAVMRFVHGLQQPGHFLYLRKVVIEPSGTRTKATVTVEALKVSTEGKMPDEVQTAPGVPPPFGQTIKTAPSSGAETRSY